MPDPSAVAAPLGSQARGAICTSVFGADSKGDLGRLLIQEGGALAVRPPGTDSTSSPDLHLTHFMLRKTCGKVCGRGGGDGGD